MFNLTFNEDTASPNGGCWVCSKLDSSMHSHHVIPQANGGRNGPRVLLCSSHHDTIHHAAKMGIDALSYNKLENKKGSFATPQQAKRGSYLIQLIIVSEEKAKQSKNKTTKMNLTLTGRENEKLTNFAKRLGLSKVATIKHLISRL